MIPHALLLVALLAVVLAPALPAGPPVADARIRVVKHERRLQLFSGTRVVLDVPIALGFNPDADKQVEGDGATPVGEFYICMKNPKSRYYLSLCISYPNAEDARRGLDAGIINRPTYRRIVDAIAARKMPPQTTPLGGQIFIHGRGSRPDWTLGCVALDDPAMKQLYDEVEVGTPVVIEP